MTCHVLSQLLTALQSLGLDYATFRADLEGRRSTLVFHNDTDACKVADALGVAMRPRCDDTRRWISADADLDGVHLTVAGPMRPLVELVR